MKNNENGFVAMDITVAVIAIIAFSTLIVSLISINTLENLKVKKETLAIIYVTEFFENIGIANYDNITEEKINELIPEDSKEDYTITTNIVDIEEKNIIKKITANISYKVGTRNYNFSMERMKAKE